MIIAGIILLVLGAFIATQNTKSALSMPMVIVGVVLLILAAVLPAKAHDAAHPELNDWYAGLMQPDVPSASCCGTADAYWCDDYYGRDGKAFCKITDDREDAPLHRPHVDTGTEIEIPTNKLKWDRSNPTGHGIIFLSRGQYVYCYVQPGGV